MVAVGLLSERGYCVQRIGADGRPYEEYPGFDSSFLEDTDVRVRVRIRGREVLLRVCGDRFDTVTSRSTCSSR
jgi:starch phosphorylase